MSPDETKLFSDRRINERHKVKLDVNYRHGNAYLFSRTSNVSTLGIFLATTVKIAKGTRIELEFKQPDDTIPLQVTGEVVWVEQGNDAKEQGLGIRFINPSKTARAKLKTLIRTMAYLE